MTAAKVAVVASELGAAAGGAARVALVGARAALRHGFDVTLYSADNEAPAPGIAWRHLDRAAVAEIGSADLVHFHRIRSVTHLVAPLFRDGPPAVLHLHDNYAACPVSSRLHGDGSICTLPRCRPATLVRRNCGGSRLRGTASAAEYYARPWILGGYRRVYRVVAGSQFVLGLAVAAGLDADRMERVWSPFSGEPPEVQQPSRGVVFLGRLEAQKGLQDLGRLAEMGLHIDCFGGRTADEVPPGLRLAGSLPESAVLPTLGGYRVMVFPSHHAENCPVSIIEAFAAGAVVVAYDVGGLKELVTPDRGVLIPLGRTDLMGAAIRELLADDARRSALADAARRFAWSEASEPVFSERLSQMYDAVLSEARPT